MKKVDSKKVDIKKEESSEYSETESSDELSSSGSDKSENFEVDHGEESDESEIIESDEEVEEESEVEKDDDNLEEKGEDVGSIAEDDKCMYTYLNNKNNIDYDGDDDDDDDLEYDDSYKTEVGKIIRGDDRQTLPFLTKYEKTRIIGTRALQISHGSKPMVKNVGGLKPEEIARLELENLTTPLIIRRPMINGSCEEWELSELTILD